MCSFKEFRDVRFIRENKNPEEKSVKLHKFLQFLEKRLLFMRSTKGSETAFITFLFDQLSQVAIPS